MHSGLQDEVKNLVYRRVTGREIIVIVTWRADHFFSSGKRSERNTFDKSFLAQGEFSVNEG